jgi:hypothetical protein
MQRQEMKREDKHKQIPQYSDDFFTEVAKYEGYENALKKAGIKIEPEFNVVRHPRIKVFSL